VKKGMQLLVGSFIAALYCLAWSAGNDASYEILNSHKSSQEHKSYFASDSHGILTFTEPKEFNLQLTPSQVTIVVKSITNSFSGLVAVISGVCELSRLQYATFLRHFPIPFRTLEMLFPSHYFW
jgi:hypothetical protein